MQTQQQCDLCRRRVRKRTKHHLIPKTRHKNKKNKRLFRRDEVKTRVAWFCTPCHKHVHALLTEKRLEAEYNTLALLSAHPDVRKFVAWIKTKPDGTTVPIRGSKNKRTEEAARVRRGGPRAKRG